MYLSDELIVSWKTKVSKRTQNNRMCHKAKSIKHGNQSINEKNITDVGPPPKPNLFLLESIP